MSRFTFNYSNDEDYPGQCALFQANCYRSIRGKKGQKELKELRAALLSLPDKRLGRGSLQDEEGVVCAIGAYAKHKGLDLSKFDPEEATDEVGMAAGMPALVAWMVVSLNERVPRGLTPERRFPEKRYRVMLSWVESQIQEAI
jgi:hypothetical protein